MSTPSVILSIRPNFSGPRANSPVAWASCCVSQLSNSRIAWTAASLAVLKSACNCCVFDGLEDFGHVFGKEIGKAADRAVGDLDRRLRQRQFQVGFDLLERARHVAGELGVRLDARFERRVLARDVDVRVECVGVPERRGVRLVGDFEPEEVAVDLRDEVVALEALAVVEVGIFEGGGFCRARRGGA